MKRKLRLFDTDLAGHRHGYMEYLAGEFPDMEVERVVGKGMRSWLSLVFSPEVILISGDYYVIFAASVGFARRLLGKKTVSVYIAPHLLHAGNGAVYGAKGILFTLAHRLRALDGYAITPFDLVPALRRMCRGWIYDIQFCAANTITEKTFPAGEQELLGWIGRKHAENIPIVVQLGFLWVARGSGRLLETDPEALRASGWAILMAGMMEEKMKALTSGAEGNPSIMLYDSSLSEETFTECLKQADILWCYYPPHYDQNSGLFCNALIHGKRTIVRKGSYVDRFGRSHFQLSPVPAGGGPPLPDDAVILDAGAAAESLDRIRAYNHTTLRQAVLPAGRPAEGKVPR